MIYHFIPDFIFKKREPLFRGPYAMNQYFYIRHYIEMLASNRVKIMKKFYSGNKYWAKALIFINSLSVGLSQRQLNISLEYRFEIRFQLPSASFHCKGYPTGCFNNSIAVSFS